jgi:nitronate monooxygenase
VFETGDVEFGVWSAGMAQGLVHDVPTVADLVARIVAEAEDVVRTRLTGLLAGA